MKWTARERLMIILCILCLMASPAVAAIKAYDPSPADGETNVSLQPVFRWKFEGDSCNIWGGLTPQDLRLVITDTTQSLFESPQTLPLDTVFYWRVDVNSGDQSIEGNIWSFRTRTLSEAAGCNINGKFLWHIPLILLPLIFLSISFSRKHI